MMGNWIILQNLYRHIQNTGLYYEFNVRIQESQCPDDINEAVGILINPYYGKVKSSWKLILEFSPKNENTLMMY